MDPAGVSIVIYPQLKEFWWRGEKEEEKHRIELTEVPPLILDLQGPDAHRVLSPIVDGHEGPRVETIARRVVRPEGQQCRAGP